MKSCCKAKTNLESTCVTLSISHNNILLNLKLQTTQLEAFEIDIKLLLKILTIAKDCKINDVALYCSCITNAGDMSTFFLVNNLALTMPP